MRIFGNTVVGAAADRAADSIEVDFFPCPAVCYLAKLSVYMDGQGSGSGAQAHRAIVATVGGAVLGVSEETVVVDGAVAGWVDFMFEPPLVVPQGQLGIGIHSGASTNSSRVYRTVPSAAGGVTASDSYADGTVSPIPSPTLTTGQMAVFATYVLQQQQPANTTDFYVARLPFAESQAIFSQGGTLRTPRFRANCGWHHTDLDDETGSVCIVREGSELEALLGERVRIRRSDRFDGGEVFCFVHNRYPIVDDLSVPRRVFLALGYPAADFFRVAVEVMT